MGCAESKLDSEDTVRRCKERRRLMKAAVHARHHLAAAQSDYCRSLRSTGSALVSFASGEHFSVSDHSPAVSTFNPPPPDSPSPSLHPPPPSSTVYSHAHQQPPPHRKKPSKVPHILSESSFPSSAAVPTAARDRYSTYPTTPSQESSIWNWDHFYPPPSPPDSDYFNHLQNHKKKENQDDDDFFGDLHGSDYNDKASNFSSNSNVMGLNEPLFQNPYGGDDRIHTPVKQSIREEVQCSEWGDHDDAMSTSNEDDEGEVKSASVFESQSHYESVSSDGKAAKLRDVKKKKKKKKNPKFFSGNSEKLSSEGDGHSSVSWGNDNFDAERRLVLRHRDFMEIASALKEYFDEAAAAGEQVSGVLELGRDQLDRSFKQLRKTIHHSTGILSSLSSSWTSKPPLTVKYQLEHKTIEESGGAKSLCSTMDRLLAWEKKLYQEVKAREGVKIEHEKKLSALQSQEYRGKNDAELDKTKASIKRLQSLILVTSQAVATTSSAIVSLRDSDLIPQLIELSHAFMYMWRSMHQSHEMQKDVVQQVRGLVDRTPQPESTSDMHRQATRDLDAAVSTWHSSFSHVIKLHRDFICSVNGWFKLTLLPVNPDSTNGQHLAQVATFVEEWKLGLDRVPDTVASEAIKSFNSVVRSIYVKQTEELKLKKRAEAASKKLEKKASSITTIEKKYYKSYSMVGLGVSPPDGLPKQSNILDARDPLAEKKAELVVYRKRVEDETAKHWKAVEVTRGMTLNNIQTGLPGVFQATASFSALVAEALETVCKCSYAI